MEEEAELRNPFPSPPSHYTNYTSHNLKLLALLRERAVNSPNASQHELLHDQSDVPEWPLTRLEKPRVDWILEDPEGYYDVFGDRWFVKEKIPSLAELGGNQLYPSDPSVDRRPALLSVLKSLLVAYSSLLESLLAPPPTPSSTAPPDWQRHVEWITVMAQNIMAAANDLRPMQARGNLEFMMRRQLELRREETRAIHAKCDALETKLADLRASVRIIALQDTENTTSSSMPVTIVETQQEFSASKSDAVGLSSPSIELEDVLRWAEEVR